MTPDSERDTITNYPDFILEAGVGWVDRGNPTKIVSVGLRDRFFLSFGMLRLLEELSYGMLRKHFRCRRQSKTQPTRLECLVSLSLYPTYTNF